MLAVLPTGNAPRAYNTSIHLYNHCRAHPRRARMVTSQPNPRHLTDNAPTSTASTRRHAGREPHQRRADTGMSAAM